MNRFATILAMGALGVSSLLAAETKAAGRHVKLTHIKPSEVAKALAPELSAMKSTAELIANDAAQELVVKAPAPLESAIAEKAAALDERASLPRGAVLMEFSVTEREADGSRHVVAAPRIVSRPGEDASVTVASAERGLELKVRPKKLADGRIRLGVSCDSWHRESGKDAVVKRKVDAQVIVAQDKPVTLQSAGDRRMTLELEVHAL